MLFPAGNTNKALCSAAILAVLDALYANLQGSKKQTMLSEMRGSRYDRLLSLVVVYISECQRSACVTSAKQSAVYLQSAKKNIVTVFRSVKKKVWWFLNLPQMRTNTGCQVPIFSYFLVCLLFSPIFS